VAETLSKLADVYADQKKYSDAEPLFKDAISFEEGYVNDLQSHSIKDKDMSSVIHVTMLRERKSLANMLDSYGELLTKTGNTEKANDYKKQAATFRVM
jgi:hypothetical protein